MFLLNVVPIGGAKSGVVDGRLHARSWWQALRAQESISSPSSLGALQEEFSSPQGNFWGLIDSVLIFDPYQFISCCLCWYCRIIPALLTSVKWPRCDHNLLGGFLVSQQRPITCDRIDPGQSQTADPKVRLPKSCCWNAESSSSSLLCLTHLKINKYNPW